MTVTRVPFGVADGRPIDLYTLENSQGMAVTIATYGGVVTSLVVPDRHGGRADIVCGFDSLDGYFSEAYRRNSPYFGCIVGRYAGRIKDGRFKLDGRTFQLATNDGPNHLHGGRKAFDKRVWGAITVQNPESCGIDLSMLSSDGDEGYPGNLAVTVEYRLTDTNELRIRYRATTDRATPLSLTNHTYFNLNGFRSTILDHVVHLSSERILVPDETNVPDGREAAVAGTACDLNSQKRIGDCFRDLPVGFEHYYIFDNSRRLLARVAEVSEPTSGRRLEVHTTEPGALFYTGRYTSDELQREDGARFGQFRGFCLETSKYPNGPNLVSAPASILQPGQHYDETTVYALRWS